MANANAANANALRRMTGTTLEPGEDSNSTGMKVRVNCADLVTRENPSTKGWLDSVRRLMLISPTKATGMPHEKILEGVLRNRGPVVIKVADSVEDLQTEMVTYNTLREHGVLVSTQRRDVRNGYLVASGALLPGVAARQVIRWPRGAPRLPSETAPSLSKWPPQVTRDCDFEETATQNRGARSGGRG